MRIAVVSDTHGKVLPTRAAVEEIRRRQVEAIIHCGDIGSGAVIELFADWPTHFVFGNVDDDREALSRAIEQAGLSGHGTFGEVEAEGRRIAFLHGDDADQLRRTIAAQDWDLVCYGHTHRRETRQEGSTVVLNPGALFRARPRSFAVVELPAIEIESVVVS